MVANRKVTGAAAQMPLGLAIGWAMSMGATLCGAMLAGALINSGHLTEAAIGYASILIVLTSSALGTAMAVVKIKRRRAYVCALSGVLYYTTLLAVTALFFDGQYAGMGVTALLVIAGSGCIVLMGLRGEKNRHSVKRRHR